MKKSLLLCLLTLLLGLAGGLIFNFYTLSGVGLFPSVVPSVPVISQFPLVPPPAVTPAPLDNAALLAQGALVLDALKAKDYKALSAFVSPSLGVTLTPFSTVDAKSDLSFTAAQIAAIATDSAQYLWGRYHGSGSEIELTLSNYFNTFVFHTDYTLAPMIGVNHISASGNSMENVAEAYPDCRYLEYYFPQQDPANSGLDWCALKLVFAEERGVLQLVGLIHSEWTI